jgi:hypothetical protein
MCGGTGAGDDICGRRGGGELFFIGENEGRCAEVGGKEECGLLVKLYWFGTPFAGFGDGAGECFTGEPNGAPEPADEAGRSKLLYDGF